MPVLVPRTDQISSTGSEQMRNIHVRCRPLTRTLLMFREIPNFCREALYNSGALGTFSSHVTVRSFRPSLNWAVGAPRQNPWVETLRKPPLGTHKCKSLYWACRYAHFQFFRKSLGTADRRVPGRASEKEEIRQKKRDRESGRSQE
jgi:hypothetical protein